MMHVRLHPISMECVHKISHYIIEENTAAS